MDEQRRRRSRVQGDELLQHLQQRQQKEEVMSDDEDAGAGEGDQRWSVPRSARNHENSNSYSGDEADYGTFNSHNEDDDLLVEMRRGRSNPYWTPEIEQVFVERIKSYPPLYDHSNENWKNTTVKDVIWEEISIEIGIPANECRRHFKHMRDKFVRHKRTGRGSRTWKAGEAMNFLVEMDLIKHRPKNPGELDLSSGPYSPEKLSKLDDPCPSPNARGEVFGTEKVISLTVTPINTPLTISSRSLRSMKRKADDQNLSNMIESPRVKVDPSFLEIPSTPKLSLRKCSSEMTRLDGNGHSGHGPSMESPPLIRPHLPILPNTPQLVFSAIPQLLTTTTTTTGKNSDPEGPMRMNGGGGGGGTGGGHGHGPNYYFGQYVAQCLDDLPQGESLMTRHKLQEILFEAQRKAANPPVQVIQFQCTGCTSRFTPI